jgi:hypothetical protein
VKNRTHVILQKPYTGHISGYRFKVYGVNKDGNISNKFAVLLVTENMCKTGKDRITNEPKRCTSIGQPVGLATKGSDGLTVKFRVEFGVYLGKLTDRSSLSASYRPLHGPCAHNWSNDDVTSDTLSPGVSKV